MKKVNIRDEELLQVENLEDFESCDDTQLFSIYCFITTEPRYLGVISKDEVQEIKFTNDGRIHIVNSLFLRYDCILVLE